MNVFLRNKFTSVQFKYSVLALILVFGHACHYDASRGNEVTRYPISGHFNINQHDIELINGYAEQSDASNSASKITTQVWGAPTFTDFNTDGQQDAVLILSHYSGGSGTFYYLVVAAREGSTYKGSKVVLLGDRILPQNIRVVENRITVQFLDRLKSEPYITPPSLLKKKLVIYDADSQQLVEVEQNFEGETDPSVMTLGMKTWHWEKTEYNNDSVHKPTLPNKFSLTFEKNGKLSITTDCNAIQGEYNTTKKQITFNNMISTQMFCEGSQEQIFAKMLESVSSYLFTSKGLLVLELKYDSGSVIFR